MVLGNDLKYWLCKPKSDFNPVHRTGLYLYVALRYSFVEKLIKTICKYSNASASDIPLLTVHIRNLAWAFDKLVFQVTEDAHRTMICSLGRRKTVLIQAIVAVQVDLYLCRCNW